MGSTLTQRNTTVSLCLTFLAFNALICTMYGAPMASCGWSLNTLPLPIPTLSTTYLKTLATQNVASLIMALSPNGLLCLINMQLTSAERAGLSHPYHRCYGMERTAEHELNNFAVKQRLEADILILQNTTTLLGQAEQYDRSHNNKISEGIRNAREQLEDIRRGLTEMTDLLAQQEALTNGVDKDSCILSEGIQGSWMQSSNGDTMLHEQGWCNGVITGYDDIYRIVYETQMVLELVYIDLMCIADGDGDIPDIICNCASRT